MIRILEPRQAGDALRTLRKAADLSQADLAERLGYDRSTINKRELGGGANLVGLIDHVQGLGHDLAIVPMPRWGVRPTGTGWPA